MLRAPNSVAAGAALALAATLTLAPTTGALADVDVAGANNASINGTLFPADEVETIRIDLPEGAVLKVKVKGRPAAKKQPKPAVTLRLLDPLLVAVGADQTKVSKSGATIKGFRAQRTGTYQIQVVGDGTTVGDYKLSLKWKSRKSLRFDLDDGGPGDESAVLIPVDAGALVSLKLKADKGSAAEPVLVRLDGPDQYEHTFDAPPAGSASHVVKKEAVRIFGDVALTVHGGGAYSCAVKIKPPKSPKTTIDLTDDALGGDPFNGGDDAFGKLIRSGGGTVVVPLDSGSPIVGSQIVISPGALPGPTPIVIGTSSPMPPQDTDSQAAGPTVFFGPEGLSFSVDADVTIPFDSETFDDANSLRVLTRDADGAVSEVVGATFDVESGLASFAVSHFSSFRVFGPRPAPPATGDLDGDGIGDLVLRSPEVARLYVGFGPISPVFVTAASWSGFMSPRGTTLNGSAPGVSRLGQAFTTGDLNGDGRLDLATSDPVGGDSGTVSVAFGRTGAVPGDAVLVSGVPGDEGFGKSVATGDVNGDGVEDLVVAAAQSSAGVESAGAVFVFFGSAEFPSRDTSGADVVLSGTLEGQAFGISVSVGDVTGDGIADITVGAEEDLSGGFGQVFLFAGSADLASGDTSTAAGTLSGKARFDRFGRATAIGDIDGDGIGDTIVGSPGDDTVDTDRGAVYAYLSSRPPGSREVRIDVSPAFGSATESTTAAGDGFGTILTAADLDGDQIDEVVVGRGQADATRRSCLYWYMGSTVSTAVAGGSVVLVDTPDFAAGTHPISGTVDVDSIDQAWDIDNDGFNDLVVYISQWNSGGGGAFVIRGSAAPNYNPVASSEFVDSGQHQYILGQPGEALGGTPE